MVVVEDWEQRREQRQMEAKQRVREGRPQQAAKAYGFISSARKWGVAAGAFGMFLTLPTAFLVFAAGSDANSAWEPGWVLVVMMIGAIQTWLAMLSYSKQQKGECILYALNSTDPTVEDRTIYWS